jgi:MOSC domain-containing protein YiiM
LPPGYRREVGYRTGMASARVISVNTGAVRALPLGGQPSGIDKRPVRGAVRVGAGGLAGDEHGDLEVHGGADQAVYSYAREDLDWWTEQLGRELRNGEFGENVTTGGLDLAAALIGETWRLGTAIVQVTAPRIPCGTFRNWMDEPGWVKRFAAAGRTGAHVRVLEEGSVAAGDDIEILARPDQRVTVAESVRAYYGDQVLMRKLLTVPGRGDKWTAIAERVLGWTRT